MPKFVKVKDVYGREYKVNVDQVQVMKTYLGRDPSEEERVKSELTRSVKLTHPDTYGDFIFSREFTKLEKGAVEALPQITLTAIYIANLSIIIKGFAPWDKADIPYDSGACGLGFDPDELEIS